MPALTVAPNTTWCPDTLENWRHFEKLKADLRSGRRRGGCLEEQLQALSAQENKQLRSLSRHLPGYEPDRI